MKYNERTELTIEQNESFDQHMYGMSMESENNQFLDGPHLKQIEFFYAETNVMNKHSRK